MTAFAKEPCLPSPADRLPSGSDWIHEIKLDGFRMMVRRDAAGVRLLTQLATFLETDTQSSNHPDPPLPNDGPGLDPRTC